MKTLSIIFAIIICAVCIQPNLSAKDLPAGQGKIWVGPQSVDGYYVGHDGDASSGSVTVWCNPDVVCCVEIVDGGQTLRLYDLILPPPDDPIPVEYITVP